MTIETKTSFELRKQEMWDEGMSVADMAVLRQELRPAVEGEVSIQALGYLPSSDFQPLIPAFVYMCDTSGHIWLLDNVNEAYVMNMMALSLGGGFRLFPVKGNVLSNGHLHVEAHATWQ